MRRPVAVLTGVVLTVAAAAVAAALVVQDAVSDHVNQEEGCWWSSGVTPAWMCEQIGIGVPAEASDRRAGYRTGERYDVGLLAFTLPTKDADAYLHGPTTGSIAMADRAQRREHDRPRHGPHTVADLVGRLGDDSSDPASAEVVPDRAG